MDQNLQPIRSQAYLNEYKGNLFEYLVATELAGHFHLQSQFTQSLGENQWKLLQHYESEVRKLDPALTQALPQLAQATAKRYLETLPPNASIARIELRGKPQAVGGKARQNEGDISVTIHGQEHPISLKLGKTGSFVNTKSAGIKSFVAEYFSPFHPQWEQQELNRYLADSHQQMGEELCQHQGVPCPEGWEQHWKQWGLSELPGELPTALRSLIHNHYKRVMAKLYDILWEFHQRDRHRFKLCLSPLLGFTADLTQIQVHHHQHQLHSIAILNQDSLSQLLNSMEWSRENYGKGLFHINFAQHRFQLRLKPMNKFTAPALKVNCSIKLQA